MRDDVKAAAERLIEEAAIHIETVVSGGHDPLTDDILTVASYALEAGQEVARLTEELAFQAKNAADAHQERAHQQRRAADALEAYGLLQDELHVYHAREELQWSKTAPEMDDCPKGAALSTPGEPESSGGVRASYSPCCHCNGTGRERNGDVCTNCKGTCCSYHYKAVDPSCGSCRIA